MRELKESSGINVDFTSRTVTLIGDDMIDVVFTDILGGHQIDENTIAVAALAIVNQYYPKYIDMGDGLPWSFGALPEDIEYLSSKMPSNFKTVPFKSDGGIQNGAV